MKVAILGYGWVGKAMQDLFPEAKVYIRDVEKHLGDIAGKLNTFTNSKEEINECDIAFVCVPTPNEDRQIQTAAGISSEGEQRYYSTIKGEGKLDTSAVEECIEWLETPLIVIRSTVNPGDCDKWKKKYDKHIVMQPEYLGETPAHPLLDTAKTDFLIIGASLEDRRPLIWLYQKVYNANVKIRQVTCYEAEVIKLAENRAIAFKVAQAQELYDVCQKAGVDYYIIREAVYGDDPRFNLWWTFVYPDKRGFNSKCIPKDIYAWCAWAESLGYEPSITRAILEKNKEWIA